MTTVVCDSYCVMEHMSVHENHLVLLSMTPSRYIVLCIEYSRKVKKKIWIFRVCEVNCQIEIYWYIRGLHHALISPFLPILFNRTVFEQNRPTQCLPICHGIQCYTAKHINLSVANMNSMTYETANTSKIMTVAKDHANSNC